MLLFQTVKTKFYIILQDKRQTSDTFEIKAQKMAHNRKKLITQNNADTSDLKSEVPVFYNDLGCFFTYGDIRKSLPAMRLFILLQHNAAKSVALISISSMGCLFASAVFVITS